MRVVLRLLRVLAAILLLGLLAYGVDWQAMPGRLAALSWPPALLAAIGLTAQFAISPWKWQWALRIHGLQFRLGYLIRANGVGFFFNNFLPSGIGGDAYRVMSTWPENGYRSRAVSAVLVERIVGFAALVAIGNVGALALIATAPSRIATAFILLSVAGAAVAALTVWGMLRGWLKPLTRRVRHTKAFEVVSHNLDYLRRAGRSWLPLIVISLLFQALAVLNIYLLFVALGVPVSLAACALIGAAAGLATVIPVSINGLGVVEGSFAGTAVALGVNYEAALTVAILIRLLVLPPSMVFGLLYAIGGSAAADPKQRAADLT
jgi:glycosyltransferase 2 family protein